MENEDLSVSNPTYRKLFLASIQKQFENPNAQTASWRFYSGGFRWDSKAKVRHKLFSRYCVFRMFWDQIGPDAVFEVFVSAFEASKDRWQRQWAKIQWRAARVKITKKMAKEVGRQQKFWKKYNSDTPRRWWLLFRATNLISNPRARKIKKYLGAQSTEAGARR